jgi:geranylgeranyl diphosphate synthase type I
MHPWFEETRPDIAHALGRLLAEGGRRLAVAGRWGPDAASRLAPFAVGGKMIRGGLAMLACGMYGGMESRPGRTAALRLAACLELLHSGLLVHDDIMDGDRLRRGRPSIFAQYEREARRLGAVDPERIGAGVGICAGDVAFFLALEAIARLPCGPDCRAALAGLAARELALVGVGQMQDVVLGAGRRLPSPAEALAVCTYKTARYTFSLPLVAGATLADSTSGAAETPGAGRVPPKTLGRLQRLGELLGTAYQLRDDDIGLYGSERETGKPVGADLREGKKTLLAIELMRRAHGMERRELARILGKGEIDGADVHRVREAAERLGARQAVIDVATRLVRDAVKVAKSLELPDPWRTRLEEICLANLDRTR